MMKKTIVALLALGVMASGCNKGKGGNRHVVNKTYVHKYGVEVSSNDWSERGKNGQVITKLDSGIVVKKNYVEGVLEGEAFYTFPHSDQVATKETYVGGKRTKETLYSIAGKPKAETVFCDGGKTITSWFDSGVPQSEEHFVGSKLLDAEYFSSNHKVESKINDGYGTRLVRDEYGQLAALDAYEGGRIKTRTTLHSNGAPKEILAYKNDTVEGTVRRFLPAGEPQTIEQWVGGKQHGITTVFQNGEKYAEVSYLQGLKNGIEKRFRDNGKTLVEEITWVNDIRHGPTFIHLDDITRVEWFFKGNNVPKAVYEINSKRQGGLSPAGLRS